MALRITATAEPALGHRVPSGLPAEPDARGLIKRPARSTPMCREATPARTAGLAARTAAAAVLAGTATSPAASSELAATSEPVILVVFDCRSHFTQPVIASTPCRQAGHPHARAATKS